MHEFCIEWAQKSPQIRREHLPDRQASSPRPTEEGEHREHPQSPARRGRLQNGRFATRQCLHGSPPLIRSAVLLSRTCLCFLDHRPFPRACKRMQTRQLLIAARKKKKDCNPVWEPKNSFMHLHCFVGSEAKQIISFAQIDCVICICECWG